MTDTDGLSGEDLARRAGAMVPALRARAQATEEAGRIPAATFDDAKAADLFRGGDAGRRRGGGRAGHRYLKDKVGACGGMLLGLEPPPEAMI